MIRGEQFYLPISVSQDGNELDMSKVKKVFFDIGENITKYYGEDGTVIYNDETKEFNIPLVQEETLELEGNEKTEIQISVLFNDEFETLLKTKIKGENVYECIVKEVRE